jgi:hypothetical protein
MRERRLTAVERSSPVAARAAWARLRRIVGYLLAAMMGAFIAALTLPGGALAHALHHRRSANWAGYAVTTAQPFRSVSGSWVQPTANCDQHMNTWAAFWVGLGGFKHDSQKLEQIGTESDCIGSDRARSYAWYELVPHPSVELRLQVRPGDRMAAHVSLRGNLVLLRIKNLTTGQRFGKAITFPSPDTSSAEWIAEAPSECSGQQCQPLPLTDFHTVQFTGASTTTATGHTGTITDPTFTATELTLSAGVGSIGPPAPPPPTEQANHQPLTPGEAGDGATPPRPVERPDHQPLIPLPAGGGATPTQLFGDGADFTVKFTPAGPTPH